MKPKLQKLINFSAWVAFCGLGLFVGMSISAAIRTGNLAQAGITTAAAIGAIASILIVGATDKKKDPHKIEFKEEPLQVEP